MTPEDEAFDDLAKRQNAWGGGFTAKRKMAADKLLEEANRSCNNIDEQRALMRDAQPPQPPQPAQPSEEWPGQSNIESPHNGCQHRGYCKQLKKQPAQEPVALHEAVISAWSLREVYFDEEGIPSMHRSPPQREWVGLTEDEMSMIGYAVNGDEFEAMRLAEAKLRSKNT